jgi:hypothetical protein
MEERLRRKVWRLERKLTLYGFDKRRGIETYKISEIEKVLKALSQKDAKNAKKLLKALVKVQQTLYDELYKIAGATELSVDTHMPESKLKEIKAWLEGLKKGRKVDKRFAEAVREVLKTIKHGGDAEALASVLLRLYKRDYDRFRVLDFLASACEEIGAKIRKPLPESLQDASEALLASISVLNLDDIVKIVERRLKT